MAKSTKAEAMALAGAGGADVILDAILSDSWLSMNLDAYPAGLDYYLLDMAEQIGWGLTEDCLGLILGIPPKSTVFWIEATKRLRLFPNLEPVIDGLELYRRRMASIIPPASESLSTRLARARSRAIRLLGTTAAEVAA